MYADGSIKLFIALAKRERRGIVLIMIIWEEMPRKPQALSLDVVLLCRIGVRQFKEAWQH